MTANSIPFTHYDAAQSNSAILLKPDTIDEVAHDHTQTNLKPDAVDTPVFEKPNAYEDLEANGEQVDDLALGIQATQLDPDKPALDDDGEEPFLTTIVRYKTRKAKMAPASTPPPSLPATWSSSTLLSHVSSTTSTTNTVFADEDLHQRRRPLSSSSMDPISPSLSTTSTTDSLNSTTSSKQLLLDSLKRRPMAEVAKYDLRKHALTQPHHHDIYIGGTKHLLFRKRQPHSYSWGFQNILYRVDQDSVRYGTKVAEARRRAFQKQITVEWGMDDNRNTAEDDDDDDDNSQVYKGTDGREGDDDDDDTEATRSSQLFNTNNTRLLFVYTTVFDHDYCIRWKRPSLSHDMVCEIRLLEEDEDKVDTTKRSSKHKHKKKWQILAEFNSNLMGYLVHIGQLSVDKRVLALVDRPDHLEAHLLITCSTLVDLMREVVQKAVGLSDGGVA